MKGMMDMTNIITGLALAAAMAAAAPAALAQSQGDWTVGLGIGYLKPKSDNGTLAGLDADIDHSTRPIFTVEYFFRDNWGVELIAAFPFKHDVSLAGNNIGDVKHLPPTVSLNYHFPTASAWKPYLGAGVNYTIFFDEDSSLGDLEVDNTWAVAVQGGLDYQISERGAARLNLRWIGLEPDVKLDGNKIGEAEIDPILVSVGYVHRF